MLGIVGWLASAAAASADAPISVLRHSADFLYSEERQRGTALWLDYQVRPAISSLSLNLYAEDRARSLCGGNHYRYLSVREMPDPDTATPQAEAAERRIEVVVDCAP